MASTIIQFSIAECRLDMEKRAVWAALTSAAHFPISGRHPAIENGRGQRPKANLTVLSSFRVSKLQMVLSTPKPTDDDALGANREVPHLTLDGENSIVMEYVAPGLTAT